MGLLKLQNITKSFGAVKALDGVDLTANEGEILALVGENGAGKSTLMKVLSGVYPFGSFSGQILWKNQELQFAGPKESEAAGISLIHQELSTFPHLSVSENMFVGRWPRRFELVDQREIETRTEEWLKNLGADFSHTDLVDTLSHGQQQMIEIVKALSKNSQLLILDEPTSSLTKKETTKLFAILRNLRSQGRSIIYISHRMEEIFELADRVTVLRDGKSVWSGLRSEVDEKGLIKHMVGRSIENAYPTRPTTTHDGVLLELQNFESKNRSSQRSYGPIDLILKKGEVVGFGGLLGSGRSELMQALVGDQRFSKSGKVLVDGKHKPFFKGLRNAFRSGFGIVCEDRKNMSILPSRNLDENTQVLKLSLNNPFKLLQNSQQKRAAQEQLEKVRTRFHNTDQKITELSGGNQQKVIFARVFENNPDILILDEPTRGVDVGAKFEIYQLMYDWIALGKSILLVSSDLPELMAMSDRIVVMADGQCQRTLNKTEFSEEEIMKWAVRSRASGAAPSEVVV